MTLALKFRILLIALVLLSCKTYAQPEKVGEHEGDSTPMVFAEQMPDYPGGYEEMIKYISTNIKYPRLARENNIEAKVLISFVVGKDGKLSDFQILGEESEWGFEEEAIRVLKNMPAWLPGRQDGKAVNVKFTLPISYKLERNRLFKRKKSN